MVTIKTTTRRPFSIEYIDAARIVLLPLLPFSTFGPFAIKCFRCSDCKGNVGGRGWMMTRPHAAGRGRGRGLANEAWSGHPLVIYKVCDSVFCNLRNGSRPYEYSSHFFRILLCTLTQKMKLITISDKNQHKNSNKILKSEYFHIKNGMYASNIQFFF